MLATLPAAVAVSARIRSQSSGFEAGQVDSVVQVPSGTENVQERFGYFAPCTEQARTS